MAFPPPPPTSDSPYLPTQNSSGATWLPFPSSIGPSPPLPNLVSHPSPQYASSIAAPGFHPFSPYFRSSLHNQSLTDASLQNGPNNMPLDLHLPYTSLPQPSNQNKFSLNTNNEAIEQSTAQEATKTLIQRREALHGAITGSSPQTQYQSLQQHFTTPSSVLSSEDTTDETTLTSPVDSNKSTPSAPTIHPQTQNKDFMPIDLDIISDTSTTPTRVFATTSSSSSQPSSSSITPSTTVSSSTYERRPRKAKGPIRPVGRTLQHRTHAKTRVPANMLPSLCNEILSKLNENGEVRKKKSQCH
jgi:hypothetical protein